MKAQVPRIGDIVEVETRKGFGYAQYTHEHKGPPRMGSLLRVIDGLFSERHPTAGDLAGQPTRFKLFFPLSEAVKAGLVRIVGHGDVPLSDQAFPMFKNGVRNPKTGKIETWWLWDGVREWRVGTLSEEEKRYPLLAVWNDTLLRERLERGWRPEDELQ